MKARLSLLSVVLAALLFVVVLPASAAPNPPLDSEPSLEGLMLRENDLCHGVILESRKLDPFEDSNPLKKPMGEVEQQKYESISSAKQYSEAYMSSGVSHDGQVAIARYAYKYETREAARNALKLLSSDILKNERKASLDKAGQEVNATAYTISLDEEDVSTVWALSVHDNVVVLTISVRNSAISSAELLSSGGECLLTRSSATMEALPIGNAVEKGSTTMTPNATAGYQYAWYVTLVYYDPWYMPHYGALFSGSNGGGQFFACYVQYPPSSIGSWNWWGDNHNVLLIEKRWLFLPDQYYTNKWTGWCYWANLN